MATEATKPKPTVEDDLSELAALFGGTVQGLKRNRKPPEGLSAAVERADLGPRHMPALFAVALAGPLSVSELAKRLGLGLSTTSTIVGQLSRAGLLARAEDEADRRRTIVQLHPEHADVLSEHLSFFLAPLRTTLERLSPDARAGFMEGFRILHEEATREGAGGPCEED
jgi:DNA-binding MarR family transcriptional regulator